MAAVVATAVLLVGGHSQQTPAVESAPVAASAAESSGSWPAGPISVEEPSAAISTPYLPGSDPSDSELVGRQTNYLTFAERVASALFSYSPTTDFQARNADLMELALPVPLGDSAGLQTDLARYTPTGAALAAIRSQATVATFKAQTVSVSQWAAKRLQDIGAQSGTYGIDVVGVQTITTKGQSPVMLSVSMGLTVACAPAVTFCGLDRVQAALLGQPSAG